LLLENAVITKKPFLGANFVAGLEIGGNIFMENLVHDDIVGAIAWCSFGP
jgi:hypothetical protein